MFLRRKSNRKSSNQARPTQSRRFAIEPLESRCLLSVTWTGGGGSDHSWSNAANWGGKVPGAADDVTIGAGATVECSLRTTIGTLTNRGTLDFDGGEVRGTGSSVATVSV